MYWSVPDSWKAAFNVTSEQITFQQLQVHVHQSTKVFIIGIYRIKRDT